MIVFKSAFKNILSGGKRTWLNVFVLSFTLVVMVAFNGLIDGWVEDTRHETIKWEYGQGQYWHKIYDKYDIFTLQDAHAKIPEEFVYDITSGAISPQLVIQASIYPQGRMQNILLKGIESGQDILSLPSDKLNKREDGVIPAVIGERMAQSTDLKEGDMLMVRWRDKNGVFDAKEIIISDVFYSKVSTVDAGQIYINLDDLYQMTGMYGEATLLIQRDNSGSVYNIEEWVRRDLKYLMADLDAMEKGGKMESYVIYFILLAVALLAVFDTQTLSIFRRQREIGTYVALGMTPKAVTRLFTLEGTCYSILATGVGAIWGIPFLIWFHKNGFPLPDSLDNIGMTLGEAMYPAFHISNIVSSIVLVILLSALISYLPARKIAKQNVVLALKGKAL